MRILYQSKRFISSIKSSYEYIVVGAGSAGCVLASKLANAGKQVLLIEAGPNYMRSPFLRYNIQIPLFLGFNMFKKSINYCYETAPQKNLNNRSLYCPRGKTLGGSSAINGMVFIRGHPTDYDRWENEGAKGWDYKSVLPYFKDFENCTFDADTKYRGNNGPMSVSRSQPGVINNLVTTFFESCKEYGLTANQDFNASSREGYGQYDMSIDKGIRNDTYRAFISKNEKAKEKIDIFDRTFVSKILFQNKSASGVEVIFKNDRSLKMQIMAKKEVIICSGAIDSPKLLMLSGIGDSDYLKSIGIYPFHHLPGVGKNLQDHLEFYIQHETKSNETLHSLSKNIFKQVDSFQKWFISKNGQFCTSHLDAGAFLYTDKSVKHPDVQIHFFPYGVIDHGKSMPKTPLFQIHIGTLRAHSKGQILLKSSNCMDTPIIDPCYLSEEQDTKDLVRCLEIGREIMSKSSLKSISIKELLPGSSYGDSYEEKVKFVKNHVESAYHPSCTCKMGKDDDKMAVLTPELKVRGLENLRVVDASSFPSIVSANLNASVIMLANKAADIILDKKLTDN